MIWCKRAQEEFRCSNRQELQVTGVMGAVPHQESCDGPLTQVLTLAKLVPDQDRGRSVIPATTCMCVHAVAI
jgi:hypothetical protein